MSTGVLLLNADAQPLSLMPLSTISWQNAVKAYFQDKVKVLRYHEDKFIRSPSFEMQLPSIVMLMRYHKLPTKAKFTRRNMYIRDGYICQYCNNNFSSDELTIDHVRPRSKGGRTSWTNCVSACRRCNTAKGQRIMQPLKVPVQPTWHEINFHSRFYRVNIPDAGWQDYIQWPEALVNVNPDLANIY